MTIGIYKLNFANTSECYIGQSVNIEVRYKQHLNLLKLGKSSKKLQKAFLDYGTPELFILLECSKEELNSSEAEAIEIFNSVILGFNTCSTAGGTSQIYGEDHGNAVYSNLAIKEVLKNLVYRLDCTLGEISDLTGVSKSVISGISCLQQHKWLQEDLPIEYNLLVDIFTKHIRRDSTKRGLKVPPFSIISPEGVVHLVENIRQFAQIYNLDFRHLSKLRTGERKSHKSWKLCPASI